jgi:hypothetical protein
VYVKGFNGLELFFKKDFINKNADFLLSTKHFEHTVSLYSWDKFLIEQYFDLEQKQITLVTLAGKKDLEKYLKEISIADLALLVRL